MKVALYLTDNKNPHDGVTKVLQETLKAFAKTGLSEKTEITGRRTFIAQRKARRAARCDRGGLSGNDARRENTL